MSAPVAGHRRTEATGSRAGRGEIAVWRIDLDGSHALDAPPADPAERERAARFAFERDRVRYLRCRRALRLLLAARHGAAPESLRFATGPHGKPCLPAARGGFNTSHAEGFALVALSEEADVGVDVELVRDRGDIHDLARGVFDGAERARLARTPPAGAIRDFLAGWTRKEAVLKAHGAGLTIEARDVPVGLERARRIVRVDDREFHVETVIDDGNALASVAAAGGWSSLRIHDFNPGDFLP